MSFNPATSKFEEKTLIDAGISGVINDKIAEISVYRAGFLPMLQLPLGEYTATESSFMFGNFYYDSFKDASSVLAQIKEVLPSEYNIADDGSKTVFAVLETQRNVAAIALGCVVGLLLVAMVVNAIYAIIKNIGGNDSTYGKFIANGLSKKDLFLSIFIENIFALLLATVVAFIASIVVLAIFSGVLSASSGFVVAINFASACFATLIALAVGIMLTLVISCTPLLSKKLK